MLLDEVNISTKKVACLKRGFHALACKAIHVNKLYNFAELLKTSYCSRKEWAHYCNQEWSSDSEMRCNQSNNEAYAHECAVSFLFLIVRNTNLGIRRYYVFVMCK